MTRTTLGASILLAAAVITTGACIIHNEPQPSAVRPGYGPVPLNIPHESVGITLAQEVSNARSRQDELRAAVEEYEQAYQEGTAAIIEEQARTRHAGIRRAQQELLRTLATEHRDALQRARTTQTRINAALAQAQDALHAQNTLRLATAVEQEQQRLTTITRRANDAAGFVHDQTRRLRRAIIDNTRRRAS